MPADSRLVEEEGVLIDNFRLVSGGRFDEPGIRVVLASGKYPARNPQQNVADMSAQIAANEKGVQELRKMVEHFTLEVVQAYMQHVQDNAAGAVRRVLGALGDGHFRYALDDGHAVEVRVSIDRAAERAIRATLEAAYPDFALLGEEYGGADRKAGEPGWIVDPIDGTISFARGIPLFGTLIALVEPWDRQCTYFNDDHVVLQLEILGQVQRLVVEPDLAMSRLRLVHPRDGAQGRGLAGTVASEQPQLFSPPDVQVDRIQQYLGAVMQAGLIESQEGHGETGRWQ